MVTAIELEDLSSASKSKGNSVVLGGALSEDQISDPSPKDGTISSWAWTVSSILFLAGTILVLLPRVILFASQTSDQSRVQLTPLEGFLALHFGIWLVAISLALVLNIPPSLPLTSTRSRSLPTHPILSPVTGAGLLTSFLSYNTTKVGSLSFIVFLLSGVIGLWGLWVVVFAGPGSTSSKTGADKRTSAFIFGNKSAASVQKKDWKKR